MREVLAARKRWLTVFRLPAYAPDLNPAEGMWANLENDLGNLAACTVDALADLTRTRLEKMQYRHDFLDGFIAETGLLDTTMTSPRSEILSCGGTAGRAQSWVSPPSTASSMPVVYVASKARNAAALANSSTVP
jgi:hypothetical protein